MPKKLTSKLTVPSLVQERLITWARCIHAQRVHQQVTAADLAARMQVSRATVHRLERGDSGIAASAYLTALLFLGVVDDVAPALDASLWSVTTRRRVTPPVGKRKGVGHGEYF